MAISCLATALSPPPLILWAWEEPKDLRALAPTHAGVAVLAERIFLGASPQFIPRHQPISVPDHIDATAVEPHLGFRDTESLRAITTHELLRIAARKSHPMAHRRSITAGIAILTLLAIPGLPCGPFFAQSRRTRRESGCDLSAVPVEMLNPPDRPSLSDAAVARAKRNEAIRQELQKFGQKLGKLRVQISMRCCRRITAWRNKKEWRAEF